MAEPPQPSRPQVEHSSEDTATTTQKPLEANADADSDPDFDDLDDVLDQFSAASSAQPKPQSEPAPSSSGPGRPTAALQNESSLPPDIPIPEGPKPNESEEEFLARLTAEMSTVMSKLSVDPAASAASSEDITKMGQELEEFTQKMESEGIQPEDLLKAILGEDTGSKVGDIATKERERRESGSQSQSPEKVKRPGSSKGKATNNSFEDTIRKTMARMESSSAAASSATAQSSKSEEDMLAEMLRALDAEGTGGQGDGDLSKMFLGMMEQLTNKDMLYDPMKELSTKYPEWLEQNKPKLPSDEYERFSRQQVIVNEIVNKYEEKGYNDEDSKCREFVWEKMQAMQAEGAPPEDLVANPFPGMEMPDLDEKGLEEGCPTQ
ncbi:Peroxisome chaperone and import receptor [Rhinocladiella similis]